MPQGLGKKKSTNPLSKKKAIRHASTGLKKSLGSRKGAPVKSKSQKRGQLGRKKLDSKLRAMTEDAFIKKCTEHVPLTLVKPSGALAAKQKLQTKGTIRPKKTLVAEKRRTQEYADDVALRKQAEAAGSNFFM